jgi:hypothetical protein
VNDELDGLKRRALGLATVDTSMLDAMENAEVIAP